MRGLRRTPKPDIRLSALIAGSTKPVRIILPSVAEAPSPSQAQATLGRPIDAISSTLLPRRLASSHGSVSASASLLAIIPCLIRIQPMPGLVQLISGLEYCIMLTSRSKHHRLLSINNDSNLPLDTCATLCTKPYCVPFTDMYAKHRNVSSRARPEILDEERSTSVL